MNIQLDQMQLLGPCLIAVMMALLLFWPIYRKIREAKRRAELGRQASCARLYKQVPSCRALQ